jgi:putative hydrolase of HD superfamily
MSMDIEAFIKIANKLKDVKRTGWVERGVKGPESVADHSFMSALLCMVLPAEGGLGGIDRNKAVKMALIHDIAEAETGDIITTEKWEAGGTMSKKERVKLEEKAIKGMLASLDSGLAEESMSLWTEFNECKTKEARFVNDVENAEAILQADVYRRKGNFKKPLDGFWDKRGLGMIKGENIKRLVLDIIGKGQ